MTHGGGDLVPGRFAADDGSPAEAVDQDVSGALYDSVCCGVHASECTLDRPGRQELPVDPAGWRVPAMGWPDGYGLAGLTFTGPGMATTKRGNERAGPQPLGLSPEPLNPPGGGPWAGRLVLTENGVRWVDRARPATGVMAPGFRNS